MGLHTRASLSSVLIGDELGQIKLVQLDPRHINNTTEIFDKTSPFSTLNEVCNDKFHDHDSRSSETSPKRHPNGSLSPTKQQHFLQSASTLEPSNRRCAPAKHKIVKILAECLQKEPAASRAITSIRPIQNMHECELDTTDKPNDLFLISNKVGQMFVCDTNAITEKLQRMQSNCPCDDLIEAIEQVDDDTSHAPILTPVYYNKNNKVAVCGGQPINQTNILIVYRNGDIQHINMGQEILQSSLKIKRKAIKTLGLGYNSDARAIHWRIDGSTGICYFDPDSTSAHMDENDPLTDIVLSSPTHKMGKKRTGNSQLDSFNKPPCVLSRKFNEQDRLVPTQVINLITSRTNQYKPSARRCKWSSITSLNLLYKKLALYDLVGSENFEKVHDVHQYSTAPFKLNDNRLALGGSNYALRVYDVQEQKAIFNCITGSTKNPLVCPSKGEPVMVGDLDWLGGNKTTRRLPNMLATCTGVDSVVRVYDLRCSKPAFCVDLTSQTENQWQPYENHPRGCIFISICASGAPYSTAVPSQQLALGSKNGQLHVIDLRFVARSHRSLGKLSGFCGGSVRDIRFVSESFETSKMISCASDRFFRIHRIQTSFTSVIAQKLATKVFLGTRPTCIQPVCKEITQSYLSSLVSYYGSESHISTIASDTW